MKSLISPTVRPFTKKGTFVKSLEVAGESGPDLTGAFVNPDNTDQYFVNPDNTDQYFVNPDA